MRKFISLFILISIPFLVPAQQAGSSNTLLWRISGRGLTRPSYLYGTMHLTDKKVFQLGDSVYKALEQTEGFAAELDINRLGTQLMNQFLKEKEEKKSVEPVKLKDQLSAETWELYKEQLEKKFSKKADKITVDDLDEVESKLQVDLFRKGEMPTFLDAWLFGQARNLGKWVGGIEDFEDQQEITEDIEGKIQTALFDDNYYRGSLDWFIKVYTEQRLDTIDTYMYRESNGKKDFLLVKRNLKMARRMDSLSTLRSTLFAVGAAHLPGDSGVITLLRKRGFTVTPVISSRKISAEKYVFKGTGPAWYPVPVKDSVYFIKMPGLAEGVELFESMGMEMKMFFDLSFMKMYLTLNLDLPEARKKIGADSLYKALRDQYASKGEVLKESAIVINGTEGREYRINAEDGEMKMQVFLPRLERVVMNAVFAFSAKSLNDAETDQFFQSFVYNPGSHRPAPPEKTWSKLEVPGLSFSVEMTERPKDKKDVVSEEGKVSHNWQVVDLPNQLFYGLSVYTMKEGMYNSGSDSIYFEAIKNRLVTTFDNGRVIDSSLIRIQHYPGFKITVRGKSKGTELETTAMTILRGGITYYLYAVYSPGSSNQSATDRFFRSFTLLPYTHPQWKTVAAPDNSFSTTAPFDFQVKEKEEGDIHPGARRYVVFDSLAAVTAYVDKTILPAWLSLPSDTAFLRMRVKQYKSWNDSVDGYMVTENPGEKTARFTVIRKGDNVVKKVKLILKGNELYELFGNFATQDLPGMYDRFYDDFRITGKEQERSIPAPGIKAMLEALQHADRKSADEIKEWWDYLSFSAADLPFLQECLLRIYPDFDTTYYGNLNRKLFDAVVAVDSNHSTINYISDHFGSISPADEYIKPFVFFYLSDIKEARSYRLLKKCMLDYPLSLSGEHYFPLMLYDSLQLTAMLFPELMKLAGSESMWSLVCGLTTSLADSNLLSRATIREYGKYFSLSAKRILAKKKAEVEEQGYQLSDLIRLLGMINFPESNALLKQFTRFDNREIKFRTLIAMLENGLPVDSRNYLTLASTDEYRLSLYEELKRIKKLNLFPLSYLSQKELGKSKLYEYATDDEDVPEMIEHAGERELLYKGIKQKFYLYKLTYSFESATYYLGVAGPYSLNPKEYSSSHDATGIYWEKEFDKTKIDELLKEYLDSMEKEEE